MADIYSKEQGKRLFGVIAAGGSTGGIIGGLITSQLVHLVGTINLLLISLFFLILCILAVFKIRTYATDSEINKEAPLGGSSIEGMKLMLGSKFLQQVALLTVISVIIGGIFYYLQADFVKQYFPDRDSRTAVFAYINVATNSLTLFFQLILIPFLLQKIKIHQILGIFPVMMLLTLTFFGVMPILYVVLAGVVLQRSGAYGIMKPPTDWLFTGLPDNMKYKFKNFLDTVIYRGGDVITQLVIVNLLITAEFSVLHWFERNYGFDLNDLTVLTSVGIFLCLIWLWNAIRVGKLATEEFKKYPNKTQSDKIPVK